MAGIALSKFGLTPRQFFKLTPRVFDFALKYNYKEQENREKFEMELMRLQTSYIVQPHIKDKINDLNKFMPFDWDKIETYEPKKEDWDEFDKIAGKWLQKQ